MPSHKTIYNMWLTFLFKGDATFQFIFIMYQVSLIKKIKIKNAMKI